MSITKAVEAALIAILAFLLKIGADAAGIPIDATMVNTLAGILIVWALAKLGVTVTEFMARNSRYASLFRERDNQ